MAVVLASVREKDTLLSHAKRLVREGSPGDDFNPPFGLSERDLGSVGSACDALLADSKAIASFFTAGGLLTGGRVLPVTLSPSVPAASVPVTGSVLAQASRGAEDTSASQGAEIRLLFSNSSAGDIFQLRDPCTFFSSRREALETTQARLQSAKLTLQETNRRIGFAWSTDVTAVREYSQARKEGHDTHLSRAERAGMRPASLHLASALATTPASPAPTTGLPESSETKAAVNTGTEATATAPTSPDGEGGPRPSPAVVIATSEDYLLSLSTDDIPPPEVARSYAVLMETCDVLLQWLGTVMGMINGDGEIPQAGTYPSTEGRNASPHGSRTQGDSGPTTPSGRPSSSPQRRTRTVRVRRFEVHDAQQVYDLLFQQVEYLFLPEYTVYDARMQRRLLQPAYIYALRDLIAEYSSEINRLERIAARDPTLALEDPFATPYGMYQRGSWGVGPAGVQGLGRGSDADSEIVFRPPLNRFYFIRNSLRMYLTTSINESDETAYLYHQQLYNGFVVEARNVARELRSLPRPSSASSPPRWETNTVAVPSTASTNFERDTYEEPSAVTARQEVVDALHWSPTPEEHGKLIAGFEAFWDVRAKVLFLKNSLEKDIKQKDRTHRTRVVSAAVRAEKDDIGLKAEEWKKRNQQLQQTTAGGGGSFWTAAKASLKALGEVVTCKAELSTLDPTTAQGEVDDDGFEMTKTSPWHNEKAALDVNVRRLWKVIEVQSTQLEHTYPGVFFRDDSEKWAQRMNSLVKKMGAVSVVFDA